MQIEWGAERSVLSLSIETGDVFVCAGGGGRIQMAHVWPLPRVENDTRLSTLVKFHTFPRPRHLIDQQDVYSVTSISSKQSLI